MSKTEGQWEASATHVVLVAPPGVSKGYGPLCSPLLFHDANSDNPPHGHRQTQVLPEDYKEQSTQNENLENEETRIGSACHGMGSTCSIPQCDASASAQHLLQEGYPDSLPDLRGKSSGCTGIL